MHRLVLTGLLPVLLTASPPASATGADTTPPIITETEFLSALVEDHPAIVERSLPVARAEAQALGAAAFDRPTLNVSREDPDGPVEQLDWAVSWQLPDPRRRLEIAAGDAAVRAAEAQRAAELWSLRLELRSVYAAWAVAAARRAQLAAQTGRFEALAERERARAERGESSGLEAHRLGLAAAELRARRALADADRTRALATARAWAPHLPATAEPVLPDLPPASELQADPPRLHAARAELEAAIRSRDAARRTVRAPELSIGWQRQESAEATADGPLLGLGWSLPLFGPGPAERAAAEAEVLAAQARLDATRREVDAERATAVSNYQHLVAAVADLEAATAGNERMVRGAEAAFRHGEADLTDLLETLRSAAESERAVLDLRQAALAAHRELERQAGPGDLTSPLSEPSISKLTFEESSP